MDDFMYRLLTRRGITARLSLAVTLPFAVAIFFFGAPAWILLVPAWGGVLVYGKLVHHYVHLADERRRGLGSRA